MKHLAVSQIYKIAQPKAKGLLSETEENANYYWTKTVESDFKGS